MKMRKPNLKIKKLISGILFVFALCSLFFASIPAQAITDVTPAKAAINPVTYTLYAVDNSTPKIKIYKKTTTPAGWISWEASSSSSIDLPAGSACYGLAVNSDGTKLYISINAGANSKIRVYNLDSAGIPTGSPVDMTAYWSSSSSPAGMALAPGKLYVADKGIGRFRVFNTETNSFEANITDQLAGKSNLYDIAVTPPLIVPVGWPPHFSIFYKIYVSQKTETGAIYVFNYNNGTISYESTITGLTYPTYLKVVGDALSSKLYVAVNGTDGVDIKVYNTADNSLIGNIRSGIVGSYGWTAFDVSSDGSWLIFKKAKNSSETRNGFYKIMTASIEGDVTAEEVTKDANGPISINIKSDGIIIGPDKRRAAVTNSTDGALQVINTSILNYPADPPTELKQYNLDGTEIPPSGEAKGNKVVVKFKVTDPDGDQLIPTVCYRRFGTSTWNHILGNPVPSGTTVTMTIPASGELANGGYEWGAQAKDPFWDDNLTSYYNGSGNVDFIINTTPPSFDFSLSVNPTSGSVQQGKSTTATVTATLTSGTTQNVSLSASGQPAGVTITFSPSSGNPTFSSTMTINVGSSVAPGTYNITVSGTGGGVTRTATYQLTVTSTPPSFDFSLSVNPTSGSVQQGNSTTATVTATLTSGTTQNVSLSASGQPEGVTITFSPSSGNPTFSSTMTINVGSSVTPETYNITISGTGGGVTKNATYQLTVTSTPSPTITSITWKEDTPDDTKNKNYVYGTIKIKGNNFGDDPGNGSRDTDQNNVTIGGVRVPDFNPDSGIEVYYWDNTTIVCGVPLRDESGTNYIVAGDLPVVVTAGGNPSNSVSIEVKPKVYSVIPTSGPVGTVVKIVGTAFHGTASNNIVSFNGTTACATSIVRSANPATIEVTVPSGATTGPLSVIVNGKTSNTNYDWGNQDQIIFTVTPPSDTTPPSAITDLRASVGTNAEEILLTWTAVGDDGNTGTASSYIVKYSYSGPITTEALFDEATTYDQSWVPKEAGQTESYVLTGLNPGKQVWVSIKARDKVSNTGALGNCATTIVKNYVPAPIITKVYPQRGPNDRINHIVIIGENLYNDMTATIGTTPLLNVHQDSPTMVQADVPARIAPGTYEITITCPGGTYDDAMHTNPDNDFTVFDPSTNPDTQAPATVTDFSASDGEDGKSTLTWTNPTDTDLREVIVIRKEGFYPTNHSDGIQVYQTMIPEPGATINYVDNGLTNGTTYYYAVFSCDTSGNWNDTVTPGSNADTGTPGGGGPTSSEVTIDLTYSSERGNIFWISIPYINTYSTASGLLAAINTQNGLPADSANLITSIGRWNGTANPQIYESYDYLGILGWQGTDFTLVTGEAVYLSISNDTKFSLQGNHDPSFAFNLPYVDGRTNIFWISLPYSGDYTTASSIVADINNSAGLSAVSGELVTSVGRWNGTANPQIYESYDYLGILGWQGTDFTFQPGEGYYISISKNLSNWKPKTK